MVQLNNSDDDKSKEPACCSGLAELLSPQLFKALADPKRLSLLVRVAEGGGPSTVSHVAKGSGVDMSVVSRHLAILREAGIIRCEKRGKRYFALYGQTWWYVCYVGSRMHWNHAVRKNACRTGRATPQRLHLPGLALHVAKNLKTRHGRGT